MISLTISSTPQGFHYCTVAFAGELTGAFTITNPGENVAILSMLRA